MEPKSTLQLPWEEQEEQSERPEGFLPDENEMLLCHFSDEELIGLTALQGEELFNGEGIPIFPYLDKISKDPEIRMGIKDLFSEYRTNPNVENEINELGNVARGLVPYPKKSPDETKNPLLADLEEIGKDGDDRVAFVPQSFVELLLELNDNKPVINPDDGLLMFGVRDLSEFISYGFPVIGMNNFANSQSGDAGGIKHMMASDVGVRGLPQQSQSMEPAQGENANDKIMQMMQQMSAQKNNQPGGQMSAPAPQGLPGMGGGLPNMLSSIGNSFQAYQSDKKKWKQKHFMDQEMSRQYRQHRDDMLGRRDAPFSNNFTLQQAINPPMQQTMASMQPPVSNPFTNNESAPRLFSHGGYAQPPHDRGLIQGYGKGQDDTVLTQVPAGSYIMDATSNSSLGDGSSGAGADVLRKMVLEIRQKTPPKVHEKISRMGVQNSKPINVRLSRDEFIVDPHDVAALGKGSLDKGASVLDRMRRNILADKAKSGGQVPKKAKNPWDYIRSK